MKSFHNEHTENLYRAILLLKDEIECRSFFEDICTVKELQDIAQRLVVAKMLKEGKSYQEVSRETGASTATISRVNKCLVYGGGGYETVLSRITSEDAQD
ncbi:MAG: helix-turn-helix domain-containing protein [Clostridia bacterium]|nr:helix-turn-helix domain-containing protein [Clostridia bacterium]MBR5446927.1 helix-turn-helix domain-containing protein [Clostridia bacterium]MBR5633488.1 helix-turn-helix domain-containing protein [Clostridia bacterium]